MICEFCEYDFDGACGKYGCPNCNGESLMFAPKIDQYAAVKCDKCDEIMNAHLLKPINLTAGFLTAGETIPAGECPDCGAVCYLVKDEPTRKMHPETAACEKCGDPIYMDTMFNSCSDRCAACQDTVDDLDAFRQAAYVSGFKDGRRQRRRDEKDRKIEFVDLFAHRIRSWNDGDGLGSAMEDSELLDMIEADAKRLGVV